MKVCALRTIATLAIAPANTTFGQQAFRELAGSPGERLGEVLCNLDDIDGDGVDDAAVWTNDGIEFPTVLLVAGATWNLQAGFRDANPTSTSNSTDAVAVTVS